MLVGLIPEPQRARKSGAQCRRRPPLGHPPRRV